MAINLINSFQHFNLNISFQDSVHLLSCQPAQSSCNQREQEGQTFLAHLLQTYTVSIFECIKRDYFRHRLHTIHSSLFIELSGNKLQELYILLSEI